MLGHHTFVWQNTESGGPAVTSTANSYSLCLVHIFLLGAILFSVTALGAGADCGDCGKVPKVSKSPNMATRGVGSAPDSCIQ